MTTVSRGDGDPVLELLYGWQPARVLMVAFELGVFRHLGRRRLTAAALGPRAGLHPIAAARLLDACAATGLLHKSGNRYWNTLAARESLLPSSPWYLGDVVAVAAGLWEQWGHLAEALRAYPKRGRPRRVPDVAREYVLANQARARRVGPQLAQALDLRGRRSLLDLGCGPGTHAELLARRRPGLKVTLLDLPPVLAVAKRALAASPARRRLRFLARDARRDPLGSGYDVALLSAVLHTLGEQDCRRLLAKVYRALAPGGQVAILEELAQDEGTWPPQAAIFSLQMLLSGSAGRAYGAAELEGWLRECGFAQVASRLLPPPAETGLVTGIKPP
ncbi:MAG: methyltransferase domain-containing protein [Chloroflexi bacterium]|nr:methyltransferase domain-containing protein [Chloroflexota bacterium]